MAGLIIRGREVPVSGVDVVNFKGDPGVRRSPEDGRARRTTWVRAVVLHTTKGIPGGSNRTAQTLRPGSETNRDRDRGVAKFWSGSGLQSGAHVVVDTDGSAICLADLATETMYHAGLMNDVSVGIELYQLGDGSVYQATIDAGVAIVETICRELGIQRQYHAPYVRPVPRLEGGGTDCVGVFGHRDCTARRGAGDPGDFVFEALARAGFEPMDFSTAADLAIWKGRQAGIPGLSVDGVAGPRTVAALTAAGYEGGLWTRRVRSVEERLTDAERRLDVLERRASAQDA